METAVIPANAGIHFVAANFWIPGHARQKNGGQARNDSIYLCGVEPFGMRVYLSLSMFARIFSGVMGRSLHRYPVAW